MFAMGCDRLPGIRRHELFAKNRTTGVDVPVALAQELRELGGAVK
jgi:hypothetical protein